MSFDYLDLTSILHLFVQVLMFGIGLYIQLKTILICQEEKSKTWHIHIVHAIVLIIIFGYDIIFLNIVEWYPEIFIVTGQWPCYVFAFIDIYGATSIGLNTLIVAIMKHLFIVYALKAMLIESKIQNFFIFVHTLFPLVVAIVIIVAYDFNGSDEYYSKCLNPTQESVIVDSGNEQSMFVIIIQMIFAIVVGSNVLEAFFYYQIFKTMKRYK